MHSRRQRCRKQYRCWYVFTSRINGLFIHTLCFEIRVFEDSAKLRRRLRVSNTPNTDPSATLVFRLPIENSSTQTLINTVKPCKEHELLSSCLKILQQQCCGLVLAYICVEPTLLGLRDCAAVLMDWVCLSNVESSLSQVERSVNTIYSVLAVQQ